MKHKQLYLRLNNEILEAALTRYHFSGEPDVIYTVYRDLIHCIRPSLYYEYSEKEGFFVLTLGQGPDLLQSKYESEGRLSEAYGVECLSLDFFQAAYKQIEEIVRREQRHVPGRIQFSDTEELPSIFDHIHANDPGFPVSLNEASIMIPSKSVVFRMGMDNSSTHDCKSCDSLSCPFRKEY